MQDVFGVCQTENSHQRLLTLCYTVVVTVILFVLIVIYLSVCLLHSFFLPY